MCREELGSQVAREGPRTRGPFFMYDFSAVRVRPSANTQSPLQSARVTSTRRRHRRHVHRFRPPRAARARRAQAAVDARRSVARDSGRRRATRRARTRRRRRPRIDGRDQRGARAQGRARGARRDRRVRGRRPHRPADAARALQHLRAAAAAARRARAHVRRVASGSTRPARVLVAGRRRGGRSRWPATIRAAGADDRRGLPAALLRQSRRTSARVAERLRARRAGRVDVVRVLPEYREFERWSTTVVNAYVTPLIDRYLGALEATLGGVAAVDHAVERRLDLRRGRARAGRAHGAVRARRPASSARGPSRAAAGFPRVISFDMGGTSTDVSLIDGAIATTTESRDRRFSGAAAGDRHPHGRRRRRIDCVRRQRRRAARRAAERRRRARAGLLRRGHRADGDRRQPAARPARSRVVSRRPHDARRRSRAPRSPRTLARQLKLGVPALAEGVVRVANANMERAIRVVSVERGHDPREFALLAFGGAGGMHACEIAERLDIGTVIVPRHAGVLSALGMLVADVDAGLLGERAAARATSCRSRELERRFAPLVAQARARARGAKGSARPRAAIERAARRALRRAVVRDHACRSTPSYRAGVRPRARPAVRLRESDAADRGRERPRDAPRASPTSRRCRSSRPARASRPRPAARPPGAVRRPRGDGGVLSLGGARARRARDADRPSSPAAKRRSSCRRISVPRRRVRERRDRRYAEPQAADD